MQFDRHREHLRVYLLLAYTLVLLGLIGLLLHRSAPPAPPPLDPEPTPLPANSTLLRPNLDPAYSLFLARHEITHGDRTRPNVALTFDCETDATDVSTVLTILQTHQVTATFFLTGHLVENYPDVVPAILNGGHELGSHSYSHPDFSDLSPAQITFELTRTEAVITTARSEPLPLRYFRFPYGRRNQALINRIALLGYQSVLWDVDAQGWRTANTAEVVLNQVSNQVQNGSIILLHCGSPADQAALPLILTDLQRQGFNPVTLSATLAPHQLSPEP